MSRPTSEPLYIIIARYQNAAQDFQNWARHSRVAYHIENRRMYLYDLNALIKFRLFFAGNYSAITIWDIWQKRHLQLANDICYTDDNLSED